ncbi:hypothetical protein ACIRU8_14415 [Streptomyces sp. NPDC101175]|uniref:hypothetical protein n=1 Tax=Streptomyces sp. NPDC101175 TaxID=3366123 RepID=UPI003832FFA8
MAGKKMIVGVVLIVGAVGACTAPRSSPARSEHAHATARPEPSESPSARPVRTSLRFSGDIDGTATGALRALRDKTGATYDYTVPDGATQCVMPGDLGSWEAQFTVRVSGIDWEISIANGASFGLPKPGEHSAVYDADTGGQANVLTFDIASDKAPSSTVIGNGFGKFQYVYYVPDDHNKGKALVTIDRGLTSGTLDAWLAPWEQQYDQEKPLFHITGRWSCNG